MQRKIIVGYDPEHGGPDVMRLSREMRDALGARRIVVTALPWPSYLASDEELLRLAEAEMSEAFTKLREEQGDPELVTRAVASGSAALALHVNAEDENAALLVLGSCHRGTVGRILAGSVGESLLHGAPCAVAIAPHGYGEAGESGIRNIAVAYDDSAESRAALVTATSLARRLGAELTILTVADYPRYGHATAWSSVLSGGEIVDAEHKHKEQLVAEALAFTPDEVVSSGRILTGAAGRLLSAASGEFDLMVVGSRSYGSLRRTLLGSTSRRLIRSAACPILILPRGVGDDPLGLSDALRTAAAEARR